MVYNVLQYFIMICRYIIHGWFKLIVIGYGDKILHVTYSILCVIICGYSVRMDLNINRYVIGVLNIIKVDNLFFVGNVCKGNKNIQIIKNKMLCIQWIHIKNEKK
eukprot:520704_1